jgi:hypothetical protein
MALPNTRYILVFVGEIKNSKYKKGELLPTLLTRKVVIND